MTGYTLDTRRRIARSPRYLATLEQMWGLPAYSRTGRWRVTASGLIPIPTNATQEAAYHKGHDADHQQVFAAARRKSKSRVHADDSTTARLRREDPSLWDLARLTPLQRWRRTHTERLIEPEPGSGLVRRGEVSLPWRKYVTAAAHDQTPPALRVHAVTELHEHTIAPCERHVTVPVGQASISWKDVKQRFITDVRYKYFTQATHVHEVSVHEVGHMLEWRCRRCHQSGFEDYTLDTLAATTHLVWQGCVKCLAKGWTPELSRRRFLQWGVGAGLGYAAWVHQFSGLTGIPFVPPSAGAASSYYYATTGSDTTGDGSSGNPYATPEKCRQQMVAGNADSALGRTGTYAATFGTATPFPAGTSYALATIVGADTGHTPTWSGVVIITDRGNTRQYIIYRDFRGDCGGSSSGVFWSGTLTTNFDPATGPHHIRFDACEAFDTAVVNGLWAHHGHHIEMLDCIARDYDGHSTTHAFYGVGKDNLVSGCEGYNGVGLLIHAWSSTTTQMATDRSVVRRSRVNSPNGRGILVQPDAATAADWLIYYNLAYKNFGQGITLRKSGTTNAGVFSNTVVGCGTGGIANGFFDSGSNHPSGTRLRNNLAVNNANFQYQDLGSGTDTTGTSNSWQISGFNADFVDSAADDYHLGSASDAIGAGVSIASFINAGTFPEASVTDLDGTAVPQDGTEDLGAFEFVAGGGGGSGVGSDNPIRFRRSRGRR